MLQEGHATDCYASLVPELNSHAIDLTMLN